MSHINADITVRLRLKAGVCKVTDTSFDTYMLRRDETAGILAAARTYLRTKCRCFLLPLGLCKLLPIILDY